MHACCVRSLLIKVLRNLELQHRRAIIVYGSHKSWFPALLLALTHLIYTVGTMCAADLAMHLVQGHAPCCLCYKYLGIQHHCTTGTAICRFLHILYIELDVFVVVQYLVNKLAWYYALNGINILLLIGRVLKRMDFQPRLGVVTRSLALAGPDLIHFCLVCGMVFVGYAMMAHLIFGNTIQVTGLQRMPPVSVTVCECSCTVHHSVLPPLVDQWQSGCAMFHLPRVCDQ